MENQETQTRIVRPSMRTVGWFVGINIVLCVAVVLLSIIHGDASQGAAEVVTEAVLGYVKTVTILAVFWFVLRWVWPKRKNIVRSTARFMPPGLIGGIIGLFGLVLGTYGKDLVAAFLWGFPATIIFFPLLFVSLLKDIRLPLVVLSCIVGVGGELAIRWLARSKQI